ncbi:hypothetical protein [Actinomadura decatromicini]|uniref:Uncharacterized protein n=1 Tax=Actinomadura decatromicini TaxID=2604572 RepID=A0A5D3FHQ0_9ACTN|nr:hypothetical protein [Actinomadura decatromicini]TYK47743.1 hypothetical protein FXF68_18715 [Actinomadura decatromicini]
MSRPPETPYGPPPPPFPPPPAAPPPRGGGAGPLVFVLIAAVVAVLVAIGGLAAWLLRDGGHGASAASSSGPVDLREPLTFRLVAAESRPPCQNGALPAPGGSACFTLGADALTVHRLDEVRAVPPDPATGRLAWGLGMTLTSRDASGFAALTGKAAQASTAQLPSGRMAMLVGGALVSEPAQVLQPITGGEVEINGPSERFTRAYVEGVVHRMTGR